MTVPALPLCPPPSVCATGDPRHLQQDGAQLQLTRPALALVMAAAHPVPTKVCRHNSRWGCGAWVCVAQGVEAAAVVAGAAWSVLQCV
jgi:hypothetical protein